VRTAAFGRQSREAGSPVLGEVFRALVFRPPGSRSAPRRRPTGRARFLVDLTVDSWDGRRARQELAELRPVQRGSV